MKIIGDIKEKTWIFDEESLSSYSVILNIGFRDNKKLPVVFDNLSFGYSLFLENALISENQKPGFGLTYVETNEDFIEVFLISDLIPQKEYTLNVWAKNSEEYWEDSFSFILPLPIKIFESYILDEESGRYLPPVPPPNNEPHIWDENSQSWQPV